MMFESFFLYFFKTSAVVIVSLAVLFYIFEQWQIKHREKSANVDRELLFELVSLIEQLSGGTKPIPGSLIDRAKKHLEHHGYEIEGEK